MLPIPFLRQLIGFYGDSLQGMVPGYLEQSMAVFARQQQQMRTAVQQTMGSFLPPGFEEVGRQNMAMLDRAMSLFSPFYRQAETGGTEAATPESGPEPVPEPGPETMAETPAEPAPVPAPAPLHEQEIARLHAELEQLRGELLAHSSLAAAEPQTPPGAGTGPVPPGPKNQAAIRTAPPAAVARGRKGR